MTRMMTEERIHHPIFARLYEKLSRGAEAKGEAAHRDELLAGLSGRVIELGAGNGLNFAHYPATVGEVVAVEPEAYLRARASEEAPKAAVPVTVVDGTAGHLPLDDASCDAGVASLVLCSVPYPATALAELRRVIRPGGELRFYEHVVSDSAPLASVQRALEKTVWPLFAGGCHPARDSLAAIEAAGFTIERCRRFDFRPSPIEFAVAPRILGTARRA